MSTSPMTIKGAQALRAELNKLKTEIRPQISKAIGAARAHGDLKENAEYHAAREQQGLAEARIRQIESRLASAHVIDVTQIQPTGKVIFGTTVQLLDLASDIEVVYRIVGEDEANIEQGLLSVFSPVARALIGKASGEQIVVSAPAGEFEYQIQSVKHI